MAKVHALEMDVTGRVRCAIHYLVPAGNNSAGVSWKNAVVGAGKNVTVLAEGTGTGQITAAEKAQIVAGDVVEVVASVEVDSSGGSAAQILPSINAVITEDKARLSVLLKWFGRAEGTVN